MILAIQGRTGFVPAGDGVYLLVRSRGEDGRGERPHVGWQAL